MKIHTIFATALTVALSVSSCSKQSGEVFTLTSPDGKLELSVQKDSAGIWEYTFAGNKEKLIKGSRLGYMSVSQGIIPSAEWPVSVSEQGHEGIWKPVWGKREEVKKPLQRTDTDFCGPRRTAGTGYTKDCLPGLQRRSGIPLCGS